MFFLWLMKGRPIKADTHHPEECCVSQGLVLVNGRQNTEDQTRQNYEKPAGNKANYKSIFHKSIINYR